MAVRAAQSGVETSMLNFKRKDRKTADHIRSVAKVGWQQIESYTSQSYINSQRGNCSSRGVLPEERMVDCSSGVQDTETNWQEARRPEH